MPQSIRSKLVILVASSLGVAYAAPSLAATAYLNFTAKWTNTEKTPLFFALNADKTITGRFVLDLDRMPSDKNTSTTVGNYSYSVPKETATPWVRFESSNLLFDRRDSDETRSGDYLDVETSGFVSGAKVQINDSQREPSYLGCQYSQSTCWHFLTYGIFLNASKQNGDGLPLSFNFDDISHTSHSFLLYEIKNTDSARGPVGHEKWYSSSPLVITDLSFVAPAPVPLPAAAWMFVAALGGLAGVKARSRKRAFQRH